MDNNYKKYYLYIHTRLDTNLPFYIGIGTKKNYNTHRSIYSRAYSTSSRNRYWKNIINKTDYKIEIILESNDYNYIKNKEVEYITSYKKLYNLSNFTAGGDGYSAKHKKSSIRKMLITKENKRRFIINKITDDVVKDYNNNILIPDLVIKYNVNKNVISKILNKAGIIKNSSDYKRRIFYYYDFINNIKIKYFLKYNELSNLLNISEGCIRNHITNTKNIVENYFIILNENLSIADAKLIYDSRVLNKSKLRREKPKQIRKIIQKDLNGNIVKIWKDMGEIIKTYNLKTSTPVLRVIKKERKTYKNSIWERE